MGFGDSDWGSGFACKLGYTGALSKNGFEPLFGTLSLKGVGAMSFLTSS